MNTPASPFPAVTRPVYWTVRREVWENRSLYLAPGIVAILEVAALLLQAVLHPHNLHMVGDLDTVEQQFALGAGFGALALPILITAMVVSAFYSLDTLYSERRDRSILFWKSLPVSDTGTVLGKALIPLVVLPAITLAIILATQIVMLLASLVILTINGFSTSILWTGLPLATMPVVVTYFLISMALWYAPMYGWLFLVSAFARRMTILWAVLPPAALCIAETFAFHTNYITRLLGDRFFGFTRVAFDIQDPRHLTFSLDKLTPGDLVSAQGLWSGLVVAALFFAAAIQLRRYRGPV